MISGSPDQFFLSQGSSHAADLAYSPFDPDKYHQKLDELKLKYTEEGLFFKPRILTTDTQDEVGYCLLSIVYPLCWWFIHLCL